MKVMKARRKPDNTPYIIITLSMTEAEQLTEDLITAVGEKRNPKTIAEFLTIQLANEFPEGGGMMNE